MFKNRQLTLTMNKKDKNETEEHSPSTFEYKADVVLGKLEDLAIKAFLGVCVYIYLDTRRQVRVEQAKHI